MPYRPPLKLFVPQDARDNDQPPPHSLCYCEQCQERRQLDRLKGEREPLIPLPKSVQAQLTDQEYHKILDGKVSESPPPISEPPASTTMCNLELRAKLDRRAKAELYGIDGYFLINMRVVGGSLKRTLRWNLPLEQSQRKGRTYL